MKLFQSRAIERTRSPGLSDMRSDAATAIHEFFSVAMAENQKVRKAFNAAQRNLHDGPWSDGAYSFEESVRILKAWWDDVGSSEGVWYETWSGNIQLVEPAPFKVSCDEDDPQCDENGERTVEPNWSDFTHFDERAVKKVVFGELAPYIR